VLATETFWPLIGFILKLQIRGSEAKRFMLKCIDVKAVAFASTRVARFSLVQHTKTGKIYQNYHKL
jgi:hypothetical protein